MKIIDLLEETYSSLTSNKVRTGLTMLGIVIGISSVIAMVSIGQGAQNSVESSIQSLGSNLIIVTPGAQKGPGTQISAGRGSAKSLTTKDVDTLTKDLTLAQAVAPSVNSSYQITAKGLNTRTQVIGVTSAYSAVRNVEIADGAYVDDEQVQSYARVAVLGPTTRDDLFGVGASADAVIGQTIKINKTEFTVIGVTQSKGGSGFTNQDDIIYIPLTSAQRFLTGDQYVSMISVEGFDSKSSKDLEQEITNSLLDAHHISDPANADFSTTNQADIVATATGVTQTLTYLLGAIAGISLIVGGIGIMNMMLTTVTERTREIGLRKAIGAQEKDISRQFLTESVVLTFSSGVIGVFLGWLISYGVSATGIVKTSVSLTAVILAFCVSAGIGIVFGYYPARRASKMNPIEALRYE